MASPLVKQRKSKYPTNGNIYLSFTHYLPFGWWLDSHLAHTTWHIDGLYLVRSMHPLCSSLCHSFPSNNYMQRRQFHHTHIHRETFVCRVYIGVSRTVKLQLTHSISLYRTILFILCIDTEKKWTHTIRTIEMAFYTQQHTQRELNRRCRWSKGKWSV